MNESNYSMHTQKIIDAVDSAMMDGETRPNELLDVLVTMIVHTLGQIEIPYSAKKEALSAVSEHLFHLLDLGESHQPTVN